MRVQALYNTKFLASIVIGRGAVSTEPKNRYARARRVKQELGTHTYRNDGRGGAPRIYKKRSTNVVYVGRSTKRAGRRDNIIQIGRKVIKHI